MDNIIAELKKLLGSKQPDLSRIRKLSAQLAKLDPSYHSFIVDAKTVIHLGRDSIKDHTTALLELVKNSYDADAYNVDVGIWSANDLIRVADNGFGMTKDQLVNLWLRIGFSGKRKAKVSELGRRKTGEKGIGRISTDRLGARLELLTLTETDGLVGLRVNWDEFDTEGKDVSEIEVEFFMPTEINIPDKLNKKSLSGTEIRITGLRQSWLPRNIETLYYELSALTPPFNAIQDFSVSLENDVAPSFSKPVSTIFHKAAEIDVSAVFDGSDEVYYSIKDKYRKKEIVDTITLEQFYSKAGIGSEDYVGMKSGPVVVRLLFFLRDSSSVLDTGLKLSELKEFLNNNNGVKIYRDNIAVKPYGFPKAQLGYDWLGLGDRKAKDPAGVGRLSTYKVSPYQLVGAVFITRDSNLELLDSAAREGLVESEAFFDMKEFTLATLRLLENHRATIYPENTKKKQETITATSKKVEQIISNLSEVKENLTFFRDGIEAEHVAPKSFIKPLQQTISRVDTISGEVGNTFTELLKWQRVLSGLATMGISSAVFGHEIEGSLTQFHGSTNTAIKLLNTNHPNIAKAVTELNKAVKHSKRISGWGAYALTRVQGEKRSKKQVQIYKTVRGIIDELRPAFEASAIEIKISGDNFYSKTYQMDIESILVNLLSNAYTACTLKKRVREIHVDVGLEDRHQIKGYYFSVADTGPGVAKEFMNSIFEPLFSTKTVGANESKSVGTGLGLTIVRSIVEDLQGDITVTTDANLLGANFKIWLPKLK